jgi:tagatose 1,6-diphosphate aldolase GatY/KbaY
MPLVSATEMLQSARWNGYAVPAFAAYNMETIRAVIETAERLNAPVIIQTTPSTIEFAGLSCIAAVVKNIASEVSVPVALHLDHGTSLEWVVRCIREGYTSVMIDASELPFKENVELVQRAVYVAHSVGVTVEAELGKIRGVEDALFVEEDSLTDPEAARVFVEQTGIDALAPSIGSAHGVYTNAPKLDLERLSEISRRVDVPIVLHGASGIPADSVRETIRRGVSKVNIATELKLAMSKALRDFFAAYPDKSDPREYLREMKSAVSRKVEEIICMVGAEGRACQ